MKFTRSKIILLAAFALAGNFSASAQSNGTAGDADYTKFSGFITDRNIFDPNRVPHNSHSTPTKTRTKTRTSISVEALGTVIRHWNTSRPSRSAVAGAGGLSPVCPQICRAGPFEIERER